MTDDPLAKALRAAAAGEMATRRAAVELLVGVDGGVLLTLEPVRKTIAWSGDLAVVDWAALLDLGLTAEQSRQDPERVADVTTLFRHGVVPRTLVNIAQLGLMEWGNGDDPDEVEAWLSAAFEDAVIGRIRFRRASGG